MCLMSYSLSRIISSINSFNIWISLWFIPRSTVKWILWLFRAWLFIARKILSTNSRFSSVVWNFCGIFFLNFVQTKNKKKKGHFLRTFHTFSWKFCSVVLIPQAMVLIPKKKISIKIDENDQGNKIFFQFFWRIFCGINTTACGINTIERNFHRMYEVS